MKFTAAFATIFVALISTLSYAEGPQHGPNPLDRRHNWQNELTLKLLKVSAGEVTPIPGKQVDITYSFYRSRGGSHGQVHTSGYVEVKDTDENGELHLKKFPTLEIPAGSDTHNDFCVKVDGPRYCLDRPLDQIPLDGTSFRLLSDERGKTLYQCSLAATKPAEQSYLFSVTCTTL